MHKKYLSGAVSLCDYLHHILHINQENNMKNEIAKYRFDQYGKMFVWDNGKQIYLFATNRNGRSQKKTISDYENQVDHEQMICNDYLSRF